MTSDNNTRPHNLTTTNTTDSSAKIPDLYRRTRQALSFGKEDMFNYQDEFQTGLDMLHELIQNDEFVDEDARQLVIDSLDGYSSEMAEKSPFKSKLVSKLLYEIKHQND